jgi:hypothetical protein
MVLGPTSGLVTGWIGEAFVLVLVISTLVDHRDLDGLRVALGALLGGALVWSFLLRSRVVLRSGDLLLRNAYVDTAVPYTLIDRFVVRSVTHVGVGSKRYVASSVGRSSRSMMRRGRGAGATAGTGGGPLVNPATEPVPTRARDTLDVADFLEEQVADRRRRARDWPGAPEGAGGEVRRMVAWPEVAVSAALAVAFVVSLLV